MSAGGPVDVLDIKRNEVPRSLERNERGEREETKGKKGERDKNRGSMDYSGVR